VVQLIDEEEYIGVAKAKLGASEVTAHLSSKNLWRRTRMTS